MVTPAMHGSRHDRLQKFLTGKRGSTITLNLNQSNSLRFSENSLISSQYRTTEKIKRLSLIQV